MTSITDPRQLMALEQARNAQRDILVQHANKAVLLLKDARGLKESQIRNVVNVAGEIESVEGLLNFIRYQIAREKGWQAGRSAKGLDFGHQVIDDIHTIVHQAACAAADQSFDHLEAAAKRTNDSENHSPIDRTALYEHAYLRLAEEYMGYLNRAFMYCEKLKSNDPNAIGGYNSLQEYVDSIRECTHGEA